MPTMPVSFRFSPADIDKIDSLCKLTGDNRTSLLLRLVNAEYDRLEGNPRLTAALTQLKQLEEQMKNIVSSLDV